MRLKLKISFLMASALLTGCETYNLERPRENLVERRQTELINRSEVIAVVNSVDIAADLEQKAARWGYELKRKEVLEGLDLYLLTFDCPPGIDPHVASAELEQLQPLSTVEANHKYVLQSAENNSPLMASIKPRRYANSLIEWPKDGCEALFNIGIIDGGVDTNALVVDSSVAIKSRRFMAGKQAAEARRHGTAIAEILVGNGRLKNTSLFNASVVSEDKDGIHYSGVESILKALDWMARSDVRVVNISLAGPYNRTLDRGIQRAADKGIIIVAAVGNEGAGSSPLYPAALEDVIAATAVDSDAHIYHKAVQGQHVDVAAPGVEVFVGDAETGRYVSGTSIATPFVVAKIASDPRYAAIKSVKNIRTLLSVDAIDLGAAGPDSVYGVGLIQANNGCSQ
ncbi:MAG: S8 family serine peptidase [Hellea sp.]